MLNRIVLIGRLTRDPELRFTTSGKAVANFTLAVDRQRPNSQGEKEADFIRIIVWDKQAETCSNYLGKGRLVAVDGRLQVRTYQAQDGQNRTIAEVVAENVRFLDRAGAAAPGAYPADGRGRTAGDSAGAGPGGPVPEVGSGFPPGDFDDGFGSEEPPF
jgi:single-strand DNA-binding protein